jgi:hypothetical protein
VTRMRNTSLPASRRTSQISRWLGAAAVAVSLVVPSAALSASPDLPRGIMGPTNETNAVETALFERTPTELGVRVDSPAAAPAATSADEGFEWADAAIGAGVVAGLAALIGVAYAARRRTHGSPRPAV